MKHDKTITGKDIFKEASGALGDIGIFIPLALGLIYLNGLNPFSVFFLSGVMYVVSGFVFGHPLPVQPLKALAVTAMVTGSSAEMIAAAALMMAFVLFVYSAANLSPLFDSLFTKPVIRGIQLGLGLLLIKKGMDMMIKEEYLFYGDAIAWSWGDTVIPLGLVVGSAGLLFILKYHNSNRVPASLLLLSFGIFSGYLASHGNLPDNGAAGSDFPGFHLPAFSNFLPAFFLLVLPQIPLTIGNSLYGTARTSNDYFGKKAERTTPENLALSLALGNTFVGLLGGMPVCHGAGGLTAHYKFGARSRVSNLIIGSILVCLAFAALSVSLTFLYLIPVSIMGCLLVFTGIEHAMLMKDTVRESGDMLIVFIIGGMAVATGNLFAGCTAGVVTKWWMGISPRHFTYKGPDR